MHFLGLRPLTAVAVGLAQNYVLLFLGLLFCGVPLHTTQETEFLDFQTGGAIWRIVP